MNILQVISSSRTSGAEKHLVLLSDALRRRGHNVLAVCPPGWLAGQLRVAGIPAVEIPMRGLGSASAILQLRRVVREHRADLIHTHLTRALYMGYTVGALARVPVVSTIHVLTRDLAYRRLPGRGHWFVAVSDYLRQALIARGVPGSRVATVHNGTDFAAEEPLVPAQDLSVRAELSLPAGALVVGQFARVDHFKGAHILVKAASDVVARHPNTYFVLVGRADPGIQQALWEMAEAGGVSQHLRFTGLRDDVPRLMQACDVVTLPSLTEACSMAIIEAMAMGKPVVATRAGGMPELVVDGDTGILVERNADALARGIIDVLSDPVRRESMGRAAQERALTRFTAGRMAQEMERLYQRVLCHTEALPTA